MRRKATDLPDQTEPRIRALVEQSMPDPHRPRLREDLEEQLEPIERSTAACYADLENMTVEIKKCARKIRRKQTPQNGVKDPKNGTPR